MVQWLILATVVMASDIIYGDTKVGWLVDTTVGDTDLGDTVTKTVKPRPSAQILNLIKALKKLLQIITKVAKRCVHLTRSFVLWLCRVSENLPGAHNFCVYPKVP